MDVFSMQAGSTFTCQQLTEWSLGDDQALTRSNALSVLYKKKRALSS